MQIESLSSKLSENSYPGRGIVIGRSEDGKYAVAGDEIYKTDSNGLKKVDTIQDYSGRWIGNSYYYFEDANKSFWCFSNGENRKVMDKIDGVEVEKDGNLFVRTGKRIKILKGKKQITLPMDIQAGWYLSADCIVHVNGDTLCVFDGKRSHKVDNGVEELWSSTDESKVYIDKNDVEE